MSHMTATDLDKVSNFEQLVELLRDKLEWPIGDDFGFDDVVFEYEASELGLKKDEVAKIREIHQLRPLTTNQPWGIFFISMEDKAIPITVLRRILKALIVKKRSGAQNAERRAWDKSDLIFATSFGKSGARELAFVHFSDNDATGDLPVMKVLGWNAQDTRLHNEHVANLLQNKLVWPDDPEDIDNWRKTWASAFELRLNQVIKSSKDLATRLADLASDIRARVNQLLGAEDDAGPMRTMLEAFRKNLIQDLNDDGFSDMFAQTIAYGMLAARISNPSGIVAESLAEMVPKTNPFLKELFGNFLKISGRDKRTGLDFDELGIRDVVNLLNAVNMEAVLRDFGDRNPKEDPVIHFYELFLKEYDPKKRMQRGVFYTPRPVVNFIVRGLDDIIRNEFGLPLGLADTTTWAEVAESNSRVTIPEHVNPDSPFIHILDPATGTGTFLVEIIDLIHARMNEHWSSQGKSQAEIQAAWNDYVPSHLLPRITAFELMMAPYTIAHMKVGLKLSETGYDFGSDERARIFLTNALEPPRNPDMEFIFMSEALAHEAKAANDAKATTPFTVIVGNPPYSAISANMQDFARKLIEPFRYLRGEKITEKGALQFEKNLNEDYVKFIARSMLFLNGHPGLVGLITNNSFQNSVTLRGLRYNIIENFSSVTIVDLHGDTDMRETDEEGRPDENVFEIKQGVAVTLMADSLNEVDSSISRIDLRGSREKKYDWLLNASRSPAEKVFLYHPLYKFDQEEITTPEYLNWTECSTILPLNTTGFESGRDDILTNFSRDELTNRVKYFATASTSEVRENFEVVSGWGKTLLEKRKSIMEDPHFESRPRHFLFGPFDTRWCFYRKDLLKTNSFSVAQHLEHDAKEKNISLIAMRQVAIDAPFSHVGISDCVPNNRCFYSKKGKVSGFPLWLKAIAGESFNRPNINRDWAKDFGKTLGLKYDDGIPEDKQRKLEPETSPEISKQISQMGADWDGRGDLRHNFGPRDLFDFIYAVLHSPRFRSRYVEFLKSDFPRIPIPNQRSTFAELVPIGRELVALHLLAPRDAPVLEVPGIRFAGNGEARVEKGYPQYDNGRVMINASRWFEDVPRIVWEFDVGGHKVCEKWLKDRAAKGGKRPSPGRVLTNEDILHYRRLVVALNETSRLMKQVDEVVKRYGGWPNAFKN